MTALCPVEERWNQNRDHCNHEQTAQLSRALARKCLTCAANAPCNDGQAEPEETVADDRAGDLRLDDVRVSGAEHEDRDDQLRGVAERDVEQTTDRRANGGRELLRRSPNPLGQWNDAEHRGDEHPRGLRVHDVLEHERNRNEHQENVQHLCARALCDGARCLPSELLVYCVANLRERLSLLRQRTYELRGLLTAHASRRLARLEACK